MAAIIMDIALNFIEKGIGEPLILLHGNGENSDYFSHQIDFFSEYYRVIAVDTRGHGRSPKGDKPFTLIQFAEDLNDFLTERQISKTNLLGFSDGANIALIFALKNQDKINKLILNSANLYPSGLTQRLLREAKAGYCDAVKYLDKYPSSKSVIELLSLMLNEPNIDPSELSNLTVPTLVICGSKDMIKRKHTLLIHQSIPCSELIIQKGDHFIAAKHPKEFNSAVLSFLQKV